jgi:hypothetical protein
MTCLKKLKFKSIYVLRITFCAFRKEKLRNFKLLQYKHSKQLCWCVCVYPVAGKDSPFGD